MASLMHSENKETIVESMMYLSEQAQEDFKRLIQRAMNMASEMSEASMGSVSTARGELKDSLSRKEREIGILNNKLIEMEKELNM
eukprot:CAMPEP_0116875424 /NCGR_PEP_ID=MMETSP0463-20121206/7381_1 /TAXON_ID=181622 /ORGANISM="Strombidinopsis sp, Strain SopsisLIS2011" /LENGTH=84 /DNA_ID=CAMNT_0004521045 /DNA_START=309 /DNA_END=563 /DNA_ORIENTATION=+